MKVSINNLIMIFPIFMVSYFFRLGESSIYIFDIYFFVFFILSIKSIKRDDLFKLLLMIFFFNIISFFGLVNAIVFYQIELQIDRFFAGLYRYSQLIYFLGFFSLYKNLYKIENSMKMKTIFLLSISFPLIYSVFFYFFVPEKVIVFNRLASYFGNPNFLGAYICLAIMPIIYTISKIKCLKYSLFYALFFLPIIVFNLIYAGSNSYWILSVVVLLISLFAVSSSLSSYLKIILYSIVSIMSLYFIIGNINFNEDLSGVSRTLRLVETVFNGSDIDSLGSGELRDNLANEAIAFSFSSIKNLLLGIGLGQSPIVIGAVIGGFVTAHNSHIVLLMEMGIIGYLYFIFTLIYFVSKMKLSKVSLCFLLSYFLAMLATPHVYLPFLWGLMIYGLFMYRLDIMEKTRVM